MKDKIFVFVIGLLLGAVLTAGGFLIYEKNHTSANTQTETSNQTMERPEMPNGEMPDGEPPEMPNGNQSDSQNARRERPSGNNTQSAQQNSTAKGNA